MSSEEMEGCVETYQLEVREVQVRCDSPDHLGIGATVACLGTGAEKTRFLANR